MLVKYRGATFFIDKNSDKVYVHLMCDHTAVSTFKVKHAYERLAGTSNVRILRYHADNGRFTDASFSNDCGDNDQILSFCGVGSHHQNGIVEKKIRDIVEYARTLLAHGAYLWSEKIKKYMQSFARKAAERMHNYYMLDKDNLSLAKRFIKTKCPRDICREHPLFCPVYVLDRR